MHFIYLTQKDCAAFDLLMKHIVGLVFLHVTFSYVQVCAFHQLIAHINGR